MLLLGSVAWLSRLPSLKSLVKSQESTWWKWRANSENLFFQLCVYLALYTYTYSNKYTHTPTPTNRCLKHYWERRLRLTTLSFSHSFDKQVTLVNIKEKTRGIYSAWPEGCSHVGGAATATRLEPRTKSAVQGKTNGLQGCGGHRRGAEEHQRALDTLLITYRARSRPQIYGPVLYYIQGWVVLTSEDSGVLVCRMGQ